MHAQSSSSDQSRTKAQRIQNEFDSKDDNELKIDRVNSFRGASNKSSHTLMPFACECDNDNCRETIQLSTEEYDHIHLKSRNFVVKPEHVSLDIEKVVATFGNFVVVDKSSGMA